jgi:hypothetical protein
MDTNRYAHVFMYTRFSFFFFFYILVVLMDDTTIHVVYCMFYPI